MVDKPQGAETSSSEPKGQELIYAARVSLDQTQMEVEDKRVNLSPGMAVTVEINCRNQGGAKKKGATTPVAGTSAKDQSVPVSDQTTRAIDEIPEGKANLIRASFRAGIKPVAIARTFRISQSLVSRVLNSTEKPKR